MQLSPNSSFLKTSSSIPPLQVLHNVKKKKKTLRGPAVFVYKFFALPKCSSIQWIADKEPCVIITLCRTVYIHSILTLLGQLILKSFMYYVLIRKARQEGI